MDYQQTVEYLFRVAPAFQQVGASAYKPGLDTTLYLDAHYEYPHRSFRSIHIGGTNGKGSTAHTLASILQSSGYRVGLFTSPHLLDFSERIRVQGQPIEQDFVVEFVAEARALIERYQPSFFELTTMMAFVYFRKKKVDFAVIEVGMGGRLDSTNIISPILSVITNVSYDHTQYLGDTLELIAREKAGIIKAHTPVVIGRADEDEVREVFLRRAHQVSAPITIAEDEITVLDVRRRPPGQTFNLCGMIYNALPPLYFGLGGRAQVSNFKTILASVGELRRQWVDISVEALQEGLANVVRLTGLRGRWEQLAEHPTLICDTAHNEDGIRYVSEQLTSLGRPLHIIFGMAADKDVRRILNFLPRRAKYYFTQARSQRALPAEELQALATEIGLQGSTYPSVEEALQAARSRAYLSTDVVFVGGSNFIVADLLSTFSWREPKREH